MKYKKTIAGCLAFTFLMTAAAFGQLPLGGGMPVIDASHIVETIANGRTLMNSLDTQGNIFTKTTNIFDLGTKMARYLPGTAGRWASSHPYWFTLASPDTYGINRQWTVANNTGIGVAGSLARIIPPVGAAGMGSAPATFQAALQQAIAAIERHNALITESGQVVGSYAMANPAYTNNLQRLAASVTGEDPNEQTYAAHMQKQAAATMLLAQGQNMGVEMQKQILLNQQALMIQQHQAAAMELNQALYTYANAQSALAGTTNTSGALSALRIP